MQLDKHDMGLLDRVTEGWMQIQEDFGMLTEQEDYVQLAFFRTRLDQALAGQPPDTLWSGDKYHGDAATDRLKKLRTNEVPPTDAEVLELWHTLQESEVYCGLAPGIRDFGMWLTGGYDHLSETPADVCW